MRDFTEKPTFLQKVFHRKPEPHYVRQTIYVCCPGCVAKVKSDPSRYSLAVYAERHGLQVARATAPAAEVCGGQKTAAKNEGQEPMEAVAPVPVPDQPAAC